jgi:putative ABC transport system permease protein
MNGVGGATMNLKIADVIRNLPHVTVVAPANAHLNTQGSVEVLYGIDYPSFNALRPFVFVSGGPFNGPNDGIVDDIFATSRNPQTGRPYAVGDTVQILNHPFKISGIVEHGKGGRKVIPLATMNDLTGTTDKCSIFYIKTDDPANNQAVIDEIHATKGLEDYPVQTMQEWMSEMTPEKLPGFNLALEIITGIAVVVGFLVIFQSMYTAVLERTREIGILKSLGSSKATIVGVVLRETAVMAVAGVILGIAGTYLVKMMLLKKFPTQHFEITLDWLMMAAIIAFVGALIGALYPAFMAARKDPIDALAYE